MKVAQIEAELALELALVKGSCAQRIHVVCGW